MTKPISLFTFGGPYVGNASFRLAHQLLESLGKLRHMRVTNHMDMVTTVPKMSLPWPTARKSAHSGAMYKHVGLNLRMSEGAVPLEISFPKVKDGYITGTIDELTRAWDQSLVNNFSWNPLDHWDWPFHTLREYNERVQAYRSCLKTLHLNDLYSQRDVVGELVPQF